MTDNFLVLEIKKLIEKLYHYFERNPEEYFEAEKQFCEESKST